MSAMEFTAGAEAALRLAQESAAELGHSYVGTEHLLLGIAREGRGPGARVLLGQGLTAQVLRVEDLTAQPNRPLYGYGCKFVGLPARAESQLRSFVFKEERQLYKQKK